MSAERVCDMSCGAMHEFALVLDKAGFTAALVQEVINSRGNKMAKTMLTSLRPEKSPAARKKEPTTKFGLFVDLGIITVPDDYVHGTRLDSFKEKYQNEKVKSFYYYNDFITDANFSKPTRVLKPGDKLWVRAFEQTVSGLTTSEERMAFLAAQKAIHVGAQGASLVWEQKHDQLPKGKWYASFDEKENLPFAGGCHRVPSVYAYSDGGFGFYLGSFENDWDDDFCLLCFCDPPALAGAEQSSDSSSLS